MYLSEAIRHEETPSHRALIKQTNGLPQPPSSPAQPSSPTQIASDLPAHERQSSLPPSSPPIYQDDEIPEFSTMPGPCLLRDNPDLIYDDYSGAWGTTMPHLNDPELRSTLGAEFQADEQVRDDLEDLDEEDFEGDGEDIEDSETEYFGSLQEAEDLTESWGTQNSDPDDWWPWADRKVGFFLHVNFSVRQLMGVLIACRKLCLISCMHFPD